MILEVADIRIQPGQQAEFDEAIHAVKTVLSHPKASRATRSTRASRAPSAMC